MINLIAMWVLLSTLGAAMVMSPEPLLVRTGSNHPLEAAKDATKESLNYAAEAARQTGEGIRQTVSSASRIPANAADSVQRTARQAADAVKDSSQAGLEKIGIAKPVETPSHFEQWESGLQAAKEKAAAMKADSQNSNQNTMAGFQDQTYEAPRGRSVIKEKVADLYDTTGDTVEAAKEKVDDTVEAAKDKVGQAAGAVKEGVLGTGERIQDGAHATYKTAEEVASAVKNKASNTAAYGLEKASEGVEVAKEKAGDGIRAAKDGVLATGEKIQDGAHATYRTAEEAASAAREKLSSTAKLGQERASGSAGSVNELASKIADSVQANINAAGGKASEAAGSAYVYAADGLKDVAAKTQQFVGVEQKPPSYQEKIQQAADQAADILRSKGKDAASYMPNLGQGLTYSSPDVQEKGSTGEYLNKAGEWLGVGQKDELDKGVKSKVGEYVEGMKYAADESKEKLSPTVKRNKDWRTEFLNELGIRSEADLSRKDVLIGNINGYYSGGVFHRAGEALSSAATATKDAAASVGEKATESAGKAGETVRHTKGAAFDRFKHAAGRIFDVAHRKKEEAKGASEKVKGRTQDSSSTTQGEQMRATYDNLTESGAEGLTATSNLLKNLTWITALWLLSSARAAHLFSFSSVFGSSLWVTFVSGYLLSRTIPRQQFGFVQSRMFPTYLRLIAGGQAVCLVLYNIMHPWTRADTSEKLQHLNLWGILLSTLANAFFLEPRATKVMFEKLKVEKEEGRGRENIGQENIKSPEATSLDDETRAIVKKVTNDFHVFHGYSSLANLMSLIGMTWHLWHLSRRLVL